MQYVCTRQGPRIGPGHTTGNVRSTGHPSLPAEFANRLELSSTKVGADVWDPQQKSCNTSCICSDLFRVKHGNGGSNGPGQNFGLANSLVRPLLLRSPDSGDRPLVSLFCQLLVNARRSRSRLADLFPSTEEVKRMSDSNRGRGRPAPSSFQRSRPVLRPPYPNAAAAADAFLVMRSRPLWHDHPTPEHAI